MATQVANSNRDQNQRPGSSEGPGPSYANAVLKLKAEGATEGVAEPQVATASTSSAEPQVVAAAAAAPENDEGGSFTPVTSHHSRKERKQERQLARRQYGVAGGNGGGGGRMLNGLGGGGGVPPPDDGRRDVPTMARRDSAGGAVGQRGAAPIDETGDSTGAAGTAAMEKKVFVEAPLPKVNPWQANRRPAAVATAAPTTSTATVPIVQYPATSSVQQLQQQPSIVRAPRDRKKYNVKVCTHRV